MNDYVWVACSITEFGEVGRERHLAKPIGQGAYHLTTKCGHNASVQGIWRANYTKPKCKDCES